MLGGTKVPLDNFLIPKHDILPKDEEETVLASFGIAKTDLPKIRATDPQVKRMDAKPGDIIRIVRKDKTGENLYYRVVMK